MSSQWEYKDFIYYFPEPGRGMWARLGSGAYSEAGAKLEFWQNCQRDIYSELQRWLDAGWEPVGEIGPACIEIRTSRSHRDKNALYWIVVVILTVLSGGLVLILALIFKSGFAEPTRFVLEMRRPLEESVDQRSVTALIGKLGKLRDDGAISQEEFEVKKRELLAKI